MTFDGSGTLFAWSECSTSACTNSDDLYTINLATGASTFVGESGLSTSNTGLAFAPSGTLYLKTSNEVYTISPLTGAPTFLVTLGTDTIRNALAFSPAGTAYSIRTPIQVFWYLCMLAIRTRLPL